MFLRLGVVALMAASAAATAAAQEHSHAEGRTHAEGDTLVIEVALSEFSFAPSTIHVPAGRPVRLVLTNVGQVMHEFMAGREVGDGDFEHDLFEGLSVEILSGEEETHAESGGHEHPSDEESGKEAGEESEHGHEMGGMHAGDNHGTMAAVPAGATVSMTFTLPESTKGEWIVACFVAGHYEAGMAGTMVVG